MHTQKKKFMILVCSWNYITIHLDTYTAWDNYATARIMIILFKWFLFSFPHQNPHLFSSFFGGEQCNFRIQNNCMFLKVKMKRLQTRSRLIHTGPKRCAISPLGSVTDWNFRAWILLCPLYTALWASPGRDMGLTVPSMKPKQFLRGKPFAATASAYSSSFTGLRRIAFHLVSLWWWFW